MDLSSKERSGHSRRAEMVGRYRHLPMREWPQEAYDSVGIMNPVTTGNLRFWLQLLEETKGMGGAVVECGTYKGESIAPLAWIMRETGDDRPLYGFDSFEGLPVPRPEDATKSGYEGRPAQYFAQTSLEYVRGLLDALGVSDRVELVKGFFEDTLPGAATGPISVLILDCDLYESYKACLQYLYGKVLPGGYIVFDEYYSPRYPGARIAIDEFFADKPEKPTLASHLLEIDPYERWFVRKR
ncbi:MAG: class I SAM-dependent methyltransferase [Candidatus Tectomicrobia bacterium]|uniref:Class I SAM-dependent methyltransferase n=1 Tax=Tectimicrobiota bacterium TaxID=2528274 RepID=A0A932MKF6_UNCTE|nr:class I SAM-dependent methyltransferase [Candidatus Tectomicrobia bacterium]